MKVAPANVSPMSKKKVTIIQRRLTHYRVAFFQSLRKVLEEREIELQLLIGTGTLEECSKHDYGELSWARQIPTRYFFKNKLCWQSVNKFLKDTDLAILTQENALLANQLIILGPRNFRVAFWGTWSESAKSASKRYKRTI